MVVLVFFLDKYPHTLHIQLPSLSFNILLWIRASSPMRGNIILEYQLEGIYLLVLGTNDQVQL